MSVIPRVAEIYATLLKIPVGRISDDTCSDNLPEWKMMRHEQLLQAVRETYDIILNDDELTPSMTVGQVRKILHRKGILDA